MSVCVCVCEFPHTVAGWDRTFSRDLSKDQQILSNRSLRGKCFILQALRTWEHSLCHLGAKHPETMVVSNKTLLQKQASQHRPLVASSLPSHPKVRIQTEGQTFTKGLVRPCQGDKEGSDLPPYDK